MAPFWSRTTSNGACPLGNLVIGLVSPFGNLTKTVPPTRLLPGVAEVPGTCFIIEEFPCSNEITRCCVFVFCRFSAICLCTYINITSNIIHIHTYISLFI